ncbi:MAG: hypothetical protein V1804_02955 [Patescibacteria group bacterium]
MKKNKKISIISSSIFLIMLFSMALFFLWFHGVGNNSPFSVEAKLFSFSGIQNGAPLSASCDAAPPYEHTPGEFDNPTITVAKLGVGAGSITVCNDSMNCKITGCAGICSATYGRGENIMVGRSPIYPPTVFSGWGGDCSGQLCNLTMDYCNKYVTGTFDLNYTLYVAKAGTGSGTITSNPVGINCGADCTESYVDGTSTVLTAVVDTGSTFAGWSGDCSGTDLCNLTMDNTKSVTATFNSNNPTLTVKKTGTGTVTSDPTGINCGTTCSATYPLNTSVTLTANPLTGVFSGGWCNYGNGVGTCNVGMSRSKEVTATFSSSCGVFSCVKINSVCNGCGGTATGTAICIDSCNNVDSSKCSNCSPETINCSACSNSDANWKEVAP